MEIEKDTVTELEILNGAGVHYPSYCLAFARRAEKLYPAAQELLTAHAFSTMPGSEEANKAGKMLAGFLGSSFRETGTISKVLALSAVRAYVPVRSFQDKLTDKIDTLHEIYADRRAGYLSGILHPAVVAQVLPQQLRTEDAASYMHHRRHYALKTVIETALMLK